MPGFTSCSAKQEEIFMIAVTGALGFIGSAVVAALNDDNLAEIDIVDFPDHTEKWRNLNGLVFNRFIEPHNFDPSEYELLFILGHDSSTGISFKQAVADYNRTINLIEQCPDTTRVIYASSAGTYGTDGFSYSDECIYELMPRSAYAMGKHMIDQWCAIQGKRNVLGVKYSNVFGPGEYHKGNMASMIYQWWMKLKKGEEVPLFEPDDLARDFIYVKDAARITVGLGFSEFQPYGLRNIGSGEATTFKEMLDLLIAAMNLNDEPKIKRLKIPEKFRFQYQTYTNLDMSRTAADIDDATVMLMKNAVREYVTYLEQDLRIGEPLSGLCVG
jgi:ADP-L-glycero-D-manno-heptose 6-epimerase